MSDKAVARASGGKPTSLEGARHDSPWRRVALVISLVLAGLLTTPAVVGYWGQRTLTDTQRYVDTVQPLVNSPEVHDVIVAKVTDAIEQQVDVEAILDDVFAGVITDRPRLQRLTGVLAGAVNAQIERVTREVVESQTFEEIWVRTNTRAQQTLHRLLEGDDSGAVTLQGDEVVLDLDEVIAQVGQRLVARDIPLVDRLPVPATDRQIVLLEAPAVHDLRTIYAFATPVASWLLPLVGLLFVASFALARRRARMTVVIGVLLAANALLLALGLSVGRQLFVNHLASTAFGPASRVFYDTLLSYLLRGQQVLLVLSLVLVVAGVLAGPHRVATGLRGFVAGGLEGLGARIAETSGAGVDGLAQRVTAHAAWLRGVAIALGVVVLVWGDRPTLPRLWWALALSVVLLAGVQVLVGAGRRTLATHQTAPAQVSNDGPA